MDTLESASESLGEPRSPGFIHRLWHSLLAWLGSNPLETSASISEPKINEDSEGSFVIAPCGYRIRVPAADGVNESVGEVLPAVRDSLSSVPPLPHVVVELLREVQDANSTAASIGRIAASDPALAASLLRTVNSAAFGLNRKVTAVQEAVSYLGLSTVRSMVVKLRLDQLLPPSAKNAADIQDLWTHSLAVSYVVDALAARVADVDRGFASTLGLLHDIGKLAILARLGGEPKGGESIEAAEIRAFGLDHAGLGAMLANGWQLPADLVKAIRWHHEPGKAFEASDPVGLRKAVMLVQVANELAKYGYPYSDQMELDGGADKTAAALGLGDSVAGVMDDAVRGAITRAILFGFDGDSTRAPRRLIPRVSQTNVVPQESRLRIGVDEALVFSAFVEGSDAAIFQSKASAAGIDKLFKDLQARSPMSPTTTLALRSLLAHLPETEPNANVEVAASNHGGRFILTVHCEAFAFAHRFADDASKGAAVAEMEFGTVLNLGWFESITITPDGSGVRWETRG